MLYEQLLQTDMRHLVLSLIITNHIQLIQLLTRSQHTLLLTTHILSFAVLEVCYVVEQQLRLYDHLLRFTSLHCLSHSDHS